MKMDTNTHIVHQQRVNAFLSFCCLHWSLLSALRHTWASLIGKRGLSSYGVQASLAGAWAESPVACGGLSSPTRGQNCVPYIGRVDS